MTGKGDTVYVAYANNWQCGLLLVLFSYHQLDVSQTLQEGLHGQTIIEFPTLHVVLPDKTADYTSKELPSGTFITTNSAS